MRRQPSPPVGRLASGCSTPRRSTATVSQNGASARRSRLTRVTSSCSRPRSAGCSCRARRTAPTASTVSHGQVPEVRLLGRTGVRRSLEESLERLGLDRVDVALIHDPDNHLEQAITEAAPRAAPHCAMRESSARSAFGMNYVAPLKEARRAVRPRRASSLRAATPSSTRPRSTRACSRRAPNAGSA